MIFDLRFTIYDLRSMICDFRNAKKFLRLEILDIKEPFCVKPHERYKKALNTNPESFRAAENPANNVKYFVKLSGLLGIVNQFFASPSVYKLIFYYPVFNFLNLVI